MSNSSDFLYYVPIFSDLPEDTIEQISQVGVKKNYNKEVPVKKGHNKE